MKRFIYLVGGVCWLVIAGGFGLFLWHYLTEGAGLQFFGMFSSTSVLLGVVHVVGLSLATLFSFVFAIYFFARAAVSQKVSRAVDK